MVLIVSPAYGRDYTNKEAAIKDWKDGKDFLIETIGGKPSRSGRYISIRDTPGILISEVRIRYQKKRKVVIV